ncbi:phosphoglyceromutase [Oceanicola granulosus HTCC2516]|uniref:2,3-bisphosphoglycerate-independent phosphoglycerate mutase n=1 Tax=Oceanicola granulosus (strain ATCC BAA-861 / DSM 15982 / KCTC 12143 / HTCC2516) TaxID=314256 RepID=Q2CD52_OCEGH|nr:2,3-bisphosphoglycerate-independent phosphoglycerate mutase [Oceanicola granulosus]EAR50626.1 phosphoglyceromutase [Oceanicola granulosus HTCC2516]
MTAPKPVVLCILDGWGLREEREANAPALAETPNFDRIWRDCPHATLTTHGRDAGLPEGQMGNSEVGHTNIGAGRVVAMDLGQIDLALEEGTYAEQPPLKDFIATLKDSGGRAHLLAVVSDGGVHGHIAHLLETARILDAEGVPVVVHAMTDGRDVAPTSGKGFVERLVEELPGSATVGTVIGRYYAMDRDERWERIETAYRAIAEGKGESEAADPVAAVEAAYDADMTDEFIPATVIEGYDGLREADGLFCLNFRADRAREILRALADPEFDGFARETPALAARLGMVDYSSDHNAWYESVFPKKAIRNTLGAWVAAQGLRQFRLAETEKYPHVTFFLNGGKEEPEAGEDRKMPKSPKVATYDLQPVMSAGEVSDAFVGAIEAGYDLIVVNYANPDMVGHTGDLDAAIKACEAVDAGLGRALEALEAAGGAIVVTADHGNCETMVDPETGGPHTAHTLNPVPVIVVGGPEEATLREGRLADLAPTVLDLMGLDQPPEMTGKSLIQR